MFKNSNLWLSRFMECIKSLLENKTNNIKYDISIIYSDSIDGTTEELKKFIHELDDTNIKLTHLNLPDRFDGIQKLAILRNTFLHINNLKKYDYMLVVDTDILFDCITISRLIKHIENPRLDSCGVIAPMIFIENHSSNINYFYDTFAYRIRDEIFSHKKPYVPIELHKQTKHKWIIEVDSVGSLYLIKTDIFTDYDIYYDTYIRNDTKNHPQRIYESEQVVLCKNIKQKTPYKIYVDLSSKVYHINLESYGLKWH